MKESLTRNPGRVGILGLGIIGQGIAHWLRGKGYMVAVWSRTPKPFPNFLPSPAEVAQVSDILQIFVTDGHALLTTVQQLRPALESRHVVLAHPTVDPSAMIDAASIVQETGARFVEAPFTGSKLAAKDGQLVYYVGGDEAAVEQGRSVLEASARDILFVGALGKASVVKIATNMISGATVQALAEAVALVKSAGIDPLKLQSAMEKNAARSAAVDLKLPKMLHADYEPHFSVKNMFKDASLAVALANMMHLDLPLTSANGAILFTAIERGWGEDDFSATFRSYFESPLIPKASSQETTSAEA